MSYIYVVSQLRVKLVIETKSLLWCTVRKTSNWQTQVWTTYLDEGDSVMRAVENSAPTHGVATLQERNSQYYDAQEFRDEDVEWRHRNLAALCCSAPQTLTRPPSYSNPTIVVQERTALGPGQLIRRSDPLLPGRSGVRIPVVVRFFATVQPGRGANQPPMQCLSRG
jgi:hypothetical protein